MTGDVGPGSTRRPGKLRLAQLNLRRLFDATCDSGECGGSEYEALATASEFDARVAQIATALTQLEADVITLAELENQHCLDAIKAKLKESGNDYPIAHVAETGLPGSIDVAVLARGKLEKIVTHRNETKPLIEADGTKTSFARELPEVHLTIASGTAQKMVIVFAAHFISKSNDDPGRRLAEARKTHELMVAAGDANADALVLLGGDLNDTPGSDPINALEEDGLIRVASDLPTTSQGTYKFNGTMQAIDHIFVTKSRASAYVPQSTKVVRDNTGGFGGSDHAAIYADFTL